MISLLGQALRLTAIVALFVTAMPLVAALRGLLWLGVWLRGR